MFEGGVRSVSWVNGGYLPSNARGKKVSSLLHATDVFPTLAHLAGADASGVDGMNAWSVITGLASKTRDELPLQIAKNEDLQIQGSRNPFAKNAQKANYTALISWPFKLIVGNSYLIPGQHEIQARSGWWKISPYDYIPPPSSEAGHDVLLFNLEEDEGEHNNVASAHPDIVAKLTDRIYAFYLNETASGYVKPQANGAKRLANPMLHNWTWAWEK